MQRSIVTLMVCAALAGCAGEDGTPQLAAFGLAVLDDGPDDVTLDVSGAWLHAPGAGNGSWYRVMEADTMLNLTGKGADLEGQAAVPPAAYDRFRIVFDSVTVGGQEATMVENGLELPLNLSLLPGQETRLALGFAWADTVFESAEGPAFEPILDSINLTKDGVTVIELTAQEIETAPTKSPVARIEGFDAHGQRFFQSDFIANSPKKRMIAVGPNLTFQASESEAVAQGATLDRFFWDFGDGNTGEGATVEHAFPLAGGNHTVRLTVVDSHGVEDAQTIKLAVAPGTASHTQRDSGTATGLYPRSCSSSSDGTGAASHTFTVPAGASPDGVPADLIQVKASLFAVGNPHAEADMDLRLLDPGGASVGTGSSDGTSEQVIKDYSPGTAPEGDWTVEVKPCVAYDVDYRVVLTGTWQALEPESGYANWLASYDDGHDHSH